jgi:hypothetical protein
MNIDFPYHIAVDGRTAATGTDDHIRDNRTGLFTTWRTGELSESGCACSSLFFHPTVLSWQRLPIPYSALATVAW